MLLSKEQKRSNLYYLVTTLLISFLFYISVIKPEHFFLIVSATILTSIFLAFLNLLYYNTYNTYIKKFSKVFYILIIIYIIVNKIYFYFFNAYISIFRISSTQTISDVGAIYRMAYNAVSSITTILIFILALINVYMFSKATFRLKYFKSINFSLIAIYLLVVTGFKLYNYEIVSYAVASNFMKPKQIDNISEQRDIFEDLKNRVHTENEYTKIASGKNLIVIQCESLQNVFVNKEYNGYEILPNINSLIKSDTLYFDDFFAQIGWGNTSDAEFLINNSFYPVIMESVYSRFPTNYFYGLPKILKNSGYNTASFHAYKKEFWNREICHANQGFDMFYHSEHYPSYPLLGWGLGDKEFLTKTAEYLKNTPQPFYGFVITLTSHTPFDVAPGMTDIKLLPEDENTSFGKYVQNINYLDTAIGAFIDELKANGLYDDSIIVLYGDHQGLNVSMPDNVKAMERYLGRPYTSDILLNVPFLIHIPGMNENKVISTTSGQIDFLPTILNILGIENDTLYFGEDILGLPEGTERAIGGTAYLPRGSFITHDFIFEMSNDSILENATIYDRKTGKKVQLLTNEKLYNMSKKLEADIKLSNIITEKDLVKPILDNNLIILNNINPQFLVFNINTKEDIYNYIDRLNYAHQNGFTQVKVNVFRRGENFYVNNPLNPANELLLTDFLEEAKALNIYVILGNSREYLVDLFRHIGRDNPSLAQICIPEIYSFEDYQYIKIFSMNLPILVLDQITDTHENITNFVNTNELFAVSMSSTAFNSSLTKRLATTNKFIYIDSINSSSETIFYTNYGVKGFYTDQLNYNTGSGQD